MKKKFKRGIKDIHKKGKKAFFRAKKMLMGTKKRSQIKGVFVVLDGIGDRPHNSLKGKRILYQNQMKQ
jgi:hypothetical protein